MFDDSFVIDRLGDVWEEVFNYLSLNTDYIYKYQDLREISSANIPSVYIRKTTGSIDQADYSQVREYEGLSSNFKLLRLWHREITVRTTILGYLKGEANPDNLYTARLLSLFLREFYQGPEMDVGSTDPAHTETDQKRLAKVGRITETKSEFIEQSGRLIEKLDLSIPVSFYEYKKLF